MNELFLTPYTLVENKDYSIDTKIIISASDFTTVPFQDGRITFSFIGCRPAGNSTYKKLAVQWLNEVQFFNQTFVQVDSFVLRNRQLLIAAKRYKQFIIRIK